MSIERPARLIEEIADALALRTGLDFTGSHRGRMHSALERELQETGSRTSEEYVAHLAGDPPAYVRLLDRLTVGETYFFRDPAQIALLRAIVASWADEPGSRRVWSAGCATGEEPYTLAMILDDAGVLDRTRIVGTDLSERAIERARQATFGKWSMRRTEPELQDRYFEERHGRHVLRRRLAEAVEYRVQSLLDGPPGAGSFDLVLCRNVLIYLHGEALQRAARALRDSLRPQGQLIVGASDPPLSVDGLALVRTPDGFLYQRAETLTATPPTQGSDTVRQPAPRRRRRRAARRGRPQLAVSDTRTRPPSPTEQVAEAVASLTAAGHIPAAEELVASAVDERPLDATVRILDASLHLHAGRLAEAAAAASAAVYLEPDLVVAHLLLGRIELQRAIPWSARRSLLTAIELLSDLPLDAEVPGSGGERVDSVLTAATELLHSTEQERT